MLVDAFAPADIPAAAEALRARVQAFIARYRRDWPLARRVRNWMEFDAAFSRELAKEGWVGLTLPTEFGGGGADAFSRYVLVEELLAAGAPVAAHWIADRQSGPLIARFGTEAQKHFYLPRICRAEIFFCIGMSEPNSGSDLASISTRAVPDDHGWLLNGSKIWTTNAQHSHYMIALARTSGTAADRQRGLSQLIIDLTLPGITIRPIADLCGDTHFSEVFFDNVRLPADVLIGTEGAGWSQVNAELAFERSGPERIYSSVALLDAWTGHLRTRSASIADEIRLGRMLARLAVLREMSVSTTAKLARGESPLIEAALVKDFGTAFEQQLPLEIADALASAMEQPAPPELLSALAYVMQISPAYSLRGGTREILRGIIARGLGAR